MSWDDFWKRKKQKRTLKRRIIIFKGKDGMLLGKTYGQNNKNFFYFIVVRKYMKYGKVSLERTPNINEKETSTHGFIFELFWFAD